MANEGEFIAMGSIIAIFSMLLLVSPPLDNLVLMFWKINLDLLQKFSVFWFFCGIVLAVVAARSRKKTR
ncbi:MAG: hypothetical protein HY223_00990 [Thaumarchaeota archaeon]|nr:hypothetical protein [Nitrososphaerota archaeon]